MSIKCKHCGKSEFLTITEEKIIVTTEILKTTLHQVVDGKIVETKTESKEEVINKREEVITVKENVISECLVCNAQVTEEDLIHTVICKCCGEEVDSVDENGYCMQCAEVENDIKDKSTDELKAIIHKLMMAQKANPANKDINTTKNDESTTKKVNDTKDIVKDTTKDYKNSAIEDKSIVNDDKDIENTIEDTKDYDKNIVDTNNTIENDVKDTVRNDDTSKNNTENISVFDNAIVNDDKEIIENSENTEKYEPIEQEEEVIAKDRPKTAQELEAEINASVDELDVEDEMDIRDKLAMETKSDDSSLNMAFKTGVNIDLSSLVSGDIVKQLDSDLASLDLDENEAISDINLDDFFG